MSQLLFDDSELSKQIKSKTLSLSEEATKVALHLENRFRGVQLGRAVSLDLTTGAKLMSQMVRNLTLYQQQQIRESQKRTYEKTKGRNTAINTIKGIEEKYGSEFVFDVLEMK
jgi:hypothetical protein